MSMVHEFLEKSRDVPQNGRLDPWHVVPNPLLIRPTQSGPGVLTLNLAFISAWTRFWEIPSSVAMDFFVIRRSVKNDVVDLVHGLLCGA